MTYTFWVVPLTASRWFIRDQRVVPLKASRWLAVETSM